MATGAPERRVTLDELVPLERAGDEFPGFRTPSRVTHESGQDQRYAQDVCRGAVTRTVGCAFGLHVDGRAIKTLSEASQPLGFLPRCVIDTPRAGFERAVERRERAPA